MTTNKIDKKNGQTLIADLPIRKRLKDCLLRLGYQTIDDVKDQNFNQLVGKERIGSKSITQLEDAIAEQCVGEIEEDRIDIDKKNEPDPLRLKLYMEKVLPEKDRFVIFGRFGLYGLPKTLQEIADILNVTRERVRQIEARGLLSLKTSYKLGLIEDSVIEEFKSYGDSCTFFNAIDFRNNEYPQDILIELLAKIFSEQYTVINNPRISNQKILCPSGKNLEEKLLALIEELSTANILKKLTSLSVKYGIPVRIILGVKKIVVYEDSVGLETNRNIFYSKTTTGKIYQTMKEYGRPITISEICKRSHLSLNQVRGGVERVTDAVNVGLSTYALKEWGFLGGFISDVAVYYLMEANEPMSSKQLTKLILKQRIVDQRSIYPGMKNDKRLVLLDNGYWALKEWGYKNIKQSYNQKRVYEVDAKQALQEVLNSNSEFFSLRQILTNIKGMYGDKVSLKMVTYYAIIRKLLKEGKIVEIKKGRYSYYKTSRI